MQFFTNYICKIPSFTIPSVGIAVENNQFCTTERGAKCCTTVEEDLVTCTKIKGLLIFES